MLVPAAPATATTAAGPAAAAAAAAAAATAGSGRGGHADHAAGGGPRRGGVQRHTGGADGAGDTGVGVQLPGGTGRWVISESTGRR